MADTLPAKKAKYSAAADAYFNTGTPIMSDAAFDALEAYIAKADPKWAGLRAVGAAPAIKEVTLPHAMGSLTKVKPDTVGKWLAKVGDSSLTVTPKLDGVSALLTTSPIGRKKLMTRGNGVVGSDITHLLKYIRIGKPPRASAIRGELMLPAEDFDKLKDKFDLKNARNAVSGVVNAKSPNTAIARRIVFVPFQQIKPAVATAPALAALAKLGFASIPTSKIKKGAASPEVLYNKLAATREASGYDLDGLVLEHPDGHRVAFKAGDEVGKTKIKSITWTAGHTGVLTPVALLSPPVVLAGATISRVTLNNAAFVATNGAGPGALVEIVRSGGVIPKAKVVVPSTANPWPTDVKWVRRGPHIYVADSDAKGNQQIATAGLKKFIVKLGIDGAQDKTLTKLTASGINTVDKLLKTSESTMVAAGLGKVASAKLRRALDGVLANAHDTDPAVIMAGSGAFNSGGIGVSIIRRIIADLGYPAIKASALSGKAMDSELLMKVAAIPTIGPKRATSFIAALPAFGKFLAASGMKDKVKQLATTGKLKGFKFAFSGFRDPDLSAAVVKGGGEYSESVTKATTHLVVLDAAAASGTKAVKAKANGASIISLDKARKLILRP